tara:strand:- start:457 stop:996 length:540 start_codon:yes stop_codon:yes gene_type:complete
MALTKVIGDGVGTLASATITSATITNQLADANMSAGSVIQVVYASLSHSSTTLSGTGFTEIGLNGNITPRSTNNVIFILYTPQFRLHSTNSDSGVGWGIKRDIGGTETRVYNTAVNYHDYMYDNGSWFDYRGTNTTFYLDSPSTTSQITYKMEARRYSGTVTIGQSNSNMLLTLMEIAT